MNLNLSIVIPTYNNEAGISSLLESIAQNELLKNAEIILVDDGSSDKTWKRILEEKQHNSFLKIIRLGKNFGQHAATLCGIAESSGDYVLTMDDDLVIHPNEIEKLIHKIDSETDVIYGEYKRKESISRRTLKYIYKKGAKIEGKYQGRGSSYRLIKGDLARKIAQEHRHFIFIDEFILWYTDRIQFVSVETNPNHLVKSRYEMRKLMDTTWHLMLYSTAIPLKIVTRVGFTLATVNFFIGLFFLRKYLIDKIEVKGYTSLIISVLFSTGLIMFSLGIIAQYMRSMLKNLNNAPLYHIAEKDVNSPTV